MLRPFACALAAWGLLKNRDEWKSIKREVAKMSANVQDAPDSLRISAQEVIRRMNRGENVYFVDARNPQAWGEADTKLPGAARVPADQIEVNLAGMPHDRMIVAYCT
jgi:hypothetical protein